MFGQREERGENWATQDKRFPLIHTHEVNVGKKHGLTTDLPAALGGLSSPSSSRGQSFFISFEWRRMREEEERREKRLCWSRKGKREKKRSDGRAKNHGGKKEIAQCNV